MDRKINNNQDDNQDNKPIAAVVGGESAPVFGIMSSSNDTTEELPPMRYV